MPRPIRCALVLFGILAVQLLVPQTARSGRIEAVRGKRYVLTDRHGPWTIMVASFSDVPDDRVVVEDGIARRVRNDEKRPGKTAIEAADELVYELRSYGIPAYVYVQQNKFDRVVTLDRSGGPVTLDEPGRPRIRRRAYEAQKRNIAVLAGNYRSSKDDAAQKTLAIVKRFRPNFLTGGRDGNAAFTTHTANGAIFHPTPGQPDPLTGAFLTMNPLLTPEQARQMAGQRDPLLLRLNSGTEFSLLKNRGKYTILVASFHGNSSTFAFNEKADSKLLSTKASTSLDTAAASAWQMTRYMRDKKTEAYVLHERYRSIVTVGSFDSPQDPRIPRIIRFFAPKPIRDPETGQTRLQYEFLTIKGAANDGGDIQLPIDPQPRVIQVPRI